MDPWRKESLGLEVGDFIIWQDVELEGQRSSTRHEKTLSWIGFRLRICAATMESFSQRMEQRCM